MKKLLILLGIVAASFIIGCGGGNNTNNTITTPDSDIDYDGAYQLTITSDISETPIAYCSGASGKMDIVNYKITGTVHSDRDDKYYISGTANNSGAISAGLAVVEGGENIAYYTGQLSPTGGEGKWEDELGCHGSWIATKE